jgi:hypothetical protein
MTTYFEYSRRGKYFVGKKKRGGVTAKRSEWEEKRVGIDADW